MNSFKLIYVTLVVWFAYNGSIFQDSMHKGSVGCPFAVDWTVAYVTPKKTVCGICFFVMVDKCECRLK